MPSSLRERVTEVSTEAGAKVLQGLERWIASASLVPTTPYQNW